MLTKRNDSRAHLLLRIGYQRGEFLTNREDTTFTVAIVTGYRCGALYGVKYGEFTKYDTVSEKYNDCTNLILDYLKISLGCHFHNSASRIHIFTKLLFRHISIYDQEMSTLVACYN